MGMFTKRTILGVLSMLAASSPNGSTAAAFSLSSRTGRTSAALGLSRGGALYSSSTAASEETAAVAATSAYDKLVTKLEMITQLSRASAVLGYDQLVFMPSSAAAERGAQMGALASVLHEKQTDPELLDLIKQALKEDTSDEDKMRLLELEQKSFLENERVPSSLAAKAAGLSASAYQDWVTAKEAKDFNAFVPTLQECFDTAMAIAKAKSGSDENLYDQMLDEFEMGMSQQRINDIFDQVQSSLVPLIASVMDSSAAPSTDPLQGTFDVQQQQALSEKLVKDIGFDSQNGRIDVSVHPFTSSMSSKDVRITSRFRTDEWYQGLAGSIHEGGHAIYEQNLPMSPLSIDTSFTMGTHESQSLFWERHIGLSKAFWKYATPIVQETFDSFDYTADQVYGAVNAASKSLIRVEADELTYPLHVILRYNIEKDVISGKLAVQDISKRWNADMKELLNVDVPSDDKGCLQDVHWSGLAFGYFPTYLLGAIAAAQLFHYSQKDIPNMEEMMESGNFAEIKEWLTDKVHRHGRRYESLDALLTDQLGEELNPKYFIDYLTKKYSDLYQL